MQGWQWSTEIHRNIARVDEHILLYGELSPDQVSIFYYQRPVAYEFTRPNFPGYFVCRAMLEAEHKRHQKPKSIVELKETLHCIADWFKL